MYNNKKVACKGNTLIRRVIFITILLYSCLFGANPQDKLNDIIDKIVTINAQLQIVKGKNKDTNSTMPQTEYGSVLSKRKKLIAKIPPYITYGKYVSPITKADYQSKVKQLKYKIVINRKNGYANAVIRDTLEVDKLDATRIFYSALDEMRDLSEASTVKNTFKNMLEESLFSLQAIDLPDIPNLEQDRLKGDFPIEQLIDSKNKIQATIDTYLQIIEYLHANIGLVNSNYIFSQLDIDHFIAYINRYSPIKNKYINLGKITFCILILSIFWTLITILRNRKFLIFIIPSKKKKYDTQTKKAIIKSTNRPTIALLIAFGARLCMSITYHPYATPSFVSTTFSILFIVLSVWFIIGVSSGYGLAFINTMVDQDSSFRKDVINLILKIFYFLVITIGFLLILGDLGVNVSAIIASLGIGGLAVAWASKDILANFFASILLLIDNSFSQGDWIVCGDVQGIVVEIGLRRTTIRTFDNALLFVPNSILANEPIRNWARRKVGRRIKMSIGLTYDSPKDKIAKCVEDIREMLLSHPLIAKPSDTSLSSQDYKQSFKQHVVSISDLQGYKRNLFVYLDEFADSSINILIYCFSQSTKWEDWLQTKEDVMFKIIDIVENHGLSFAFPSQSLYVESMPKDELKDKLLENKEKM